MKRPRQRTVWILGSVLLLAVVLAKPALRQWLALRYWVAFSRDIDHRMEPHQAADINADGIRSMREASDITSDSFNVIMLGDSFIYGFLLKAHRAPPAAFEQIARKHFDTQRINVWNFGWTSSSPYLSYRLLRDIGPRYQPDLVILNVDMTDFKDDYFYRRALSGDGFYRHLQEHPVRFFAWKRLLEQLPFEWAREQHRRYFGYPPGGDYFITRQPGEESTVYFDTVRDSLNRINRYVTEELEVPFVVFVAPRHWQYTDDESPDSWEADGFDVLGPYVLEPFRYFERVAPELPYPVVPLLDDFRNNPKRPLTFKSDSHWNMFGAHFAAKAMFRHCLKLGCFEGLTKESAGTK